MARRCRPRQGSQRAAIKFSRQGKAWHANAMHGDAGQGKDIKMIREIVSYCCHASVVTYEGCDSEDLGVCPECNEKCSYVDVCVECDEEVLDDTCGCRSEAEIASMQEALAEYPAAIRYGMFEPKLD